MKFQSTSLSYIQIGLLVVHKVFNINASIKSVVKEILKHRYSEGEKVLLEHELISFRCFATDSFTFRLCSFTYYFVNDTYKYLIALFKIKYYDGNYTATTHLNIP